jgi:hypothetical protein
MLPLYITLHGGPTSGLPRLGSQLGMLLCDLVDKWLRWPCNTQLISNRAALTKSIHICERAARSPLQVLWGHVSWRAPDQAGVVASSRVNGVWLELG